MKYLFFDIECSNCYGGIGKMCEFGYVLTDDKFNVIYKDELPMSPGSKGDVRFDSKIHIRDPKFNWAYDIDYYFDQPEFPYLYNEIKKLMLDKDTIVLGHSVNNDILYLDASCLRYKLEYDSNIVYLKDLYSEEENNNEEINESNV